MRGKLFSAVNAGIVEEGLLSRSWRIRGHLEERIRGLQGVLREERGFRG